MLWENTEAVIHESILHSDRDAWEACVPQDNFFLRWDYLAAFERTAAPGISFYYVQLLKKGKPVAAFYFQRILLSAEEIGQVLMPLSSGNAFPGIIGQLGEWLKKTREEKGFRMLVSGNNFISGEYAVGLARNADSREVYDGLAAVIKWITREDRGPAKISAILVKDFFSTRKVIPSDRLKRKRYHRFKVEPEMIIDLDPAWKNSEDYAAAMSKKYRNRFKSVLKKSSVLEPEELDVNAAIALNDELYRLYRNVHEKAKFRLGALGENYFAEMKKAFPGIFCLVVYRHEGKIVAFRSSFRTNSHLEAHMIGLDYSCNNELCLYQRILYDYVAEGIRKGASRIFFGRTAAEIKSTVGAVAHDLVCYIRHRNGLSNQVIRPFIDYLQPSDWIPRNPFRESKDGE